MTAITSNVSTTTDAQTLSTGDTYNLAITDYLIATAGHGLVLNGAGQNYNLGINGVISASSVSFFVGLLASGSTNTYTISLTNSASVTGYVGIYLEGSNIVTNAGSIVAKYIGIEMFNAAYGNVDNSGSIISDDTAIAFAGTSTGPLSILNSGLISGTAAAVISENARTDTIQNNGIIKGDIYLYGGDDLVQNNLIVSTKENGIIYGTSYLGAGADEYQGGAAPDTVSGGDDADRLFGFGGIDVLNGDAGSDQLDGGLGHDTLTGGAGSDVFLFSAIDASRAIDTITDFSHVDDTINLQYQAFRGLGPSETVLSKAAFKDLALGKADSSDRILFDSAGDNVFYDRDGSGTHFKRIMIAHLDGDPTLTANDFFVSLF